jgi:uncharacterized protein
MYSAFSQFAVTLMVNHACNLRCSYCYTGAKFNSAMPWEIGVAGIDCALTSTAESGLLEVAFFGGEPLVESGWILKWMQYARVAAENSGRRVRFSLTTNGTINNPEAWQVMRTRDLELAVSYDGSPEMHDRHRIDSAGRQTAHLVEATIRRLLSEGRELMVNAVVRPDTVDPLQAGLEYLHEMGVQHVNLSLDLWTPWTVSDGKRLEQGVALAGELWARWLPGFSINWFDAKAAELAGLKSTEESVRCGFGAGEIAIAPSGNLYPCERIIGEDRSDNPLRLPGHVLDENDFLNYSPPPLSRCDPCSQCALASICDTGCRCSNFVRTGGVNRPDGLLCRLNKATTLATATALARIATQKTNAQRKECYAF